MKKVILITSEFPYGYGEQFLETEVRYYEDIELTILPKLGSERIRDLSNKIMVDNFLVHNSFTQSKFIYLFKSFKSKLFYQEFFSENFLNIKKFKIFLSTMYLYQMYYDLFNTYFSDIQDLKNVVVYTYWNDEVTYALQSLKKKYPYQLVSRIHRGDLYKESQSYHYMPLKKHFTNKIDKVYTITQSANDYLENTYGFDKNILQLARLGVEDKHISTKSSQGNSLNLVSCSFLTEVKQVDKIIKSIKIIATKMENINFNWVHIGNGVLYDDLSLLAAKELDTLDNVKYDFVGNYSNAKVYEFYLQNEVDVFLNVSLSEGVPVSIMEAMSCRIPIVAPDIGGVKDMVRDGYNGVLLSAECFVEEIVEAVQHIDFFKNEQTRKNSYNLFLDKYDARKNYKNFIQEVIKV